MEGRAYLIGCGIIKEHLTQEAIRIIKTADVILYDRLIDRSVLNLAKGKKIYVGKKPGQSKKQTAINRLLYDHIRDGKTVARLKAGDPFIFGRGFEECEHLRKQGVSVQVIPGISAYSILEKIGVPLTSRGISSSVAFVTGSRQGRKKIQAPSADTLVYYMAIDNLEKIVRRAIKRGRHKRALIVENAFKENQRVIESNVKNIVDLAKDAKVEAPALLVFSNFQRSIHGKKILTFRQADLEAETKSILKDFDAVNYPLFEIISRNFTVPVAKVHAFTSRNAVKAVLSDHKLKGKFVAIGDKTRAQLRKYGVKASVPFLKTSTGLMDYLKRFKKSDVIIYCSHKSKVRGYTRVFAYDCRYKKKLPGLLQHIKDADIIFLTSSHIVRTVSKFTTYINKKTVVAVGPQTASEAKNNNLRVDFMLENPNIEGVNRLR